MMNEIDIDALLGMGLWVTVSPLAHDTGWVCSVYKQGKKTGNWITENVKTCDTPIDAYDWAWEQIDKLRSRV